MRKVSAEVGRQDERYEKEDIARYLLIGDLLLSNIKRRKEKEIYG